MGSGLLGNVQEACYKVRRCSWYPALAMSRMTPVNKKKKGRARLIARRVERDEKVTVVCSRYEKEGKPS